MSDIAFPLSEELEADLTSGDQALPIGVLGTSSERLTGGLEEGHSPHTSGTYSIQLFVMELQITYPEQTSVFIKYEMYLWCCFWVTFSFICEALIFS